jgi:VIT1/CCC1 family predicted Fe2+/Mn2+ transporter
MMADEYVTYIVVLDREKNESVLVCYQKWFSEELSSELFLLELRGLDDGQQLSNSVDGGLHFASL